MFIHPLSKDIHPFMIEKMTSIDSSSMMYRPNQKLLMIIHTSLLYFMFNIIHFRNTISLGFDGCHPKQSRPSPHGTKSTLTYDFGGEPYESAFRKRQPHALA
jgi:hypothetical protein